MSFTVPAMLRLLVRPALCAGLVAPLLLCASLPAHAAAVAVDCHYSYGGETHTLRTRPSTSPYAVDSVAVGSYFRFRVVLQTRPADLASVQVYTYADRDEDGVVLIHQASYAFPPAAQPARGYGFTGQHRVYEPVRDGELLYWCERR